MGFRHPVAFAMSAALLALTGCWLASPSDTETSEPDKAKQAEPEPQADPKAPKTDTPPSKDAPDFHACAQLSPPADPTPEDAPPGTSFLVGFNDRLWRNGQTINVVFRDGNKKAWKRAAEHARDWTKHANLRLRFFAPDRAPDNVHIAVRFGCDGYWSMLGRDSVSTARSGGHSMCLGGLDRLVDRDKTEFQRVVAHEFGHALGMSHEHQNPKAGFEWNEPYIYDYYQRTHGWDRQMVRHNVIQRLDIDASNGFATEFDPKSVMLYAFPAQFTKDGSSTGWNTRLSPTDRDAIAQIYPGRGDKEPDEETEGEKPTKKGKKVEKVALEIRNKARFKETRNGRDYYKWQVYINAPDKTLAKIDKVLYLLHPSFKKRLRKGNPDKKGFPLVASSWGTFTVRTMIIFKDGRVVQKNHKLRFK